MGQGRCYRSVLVLGAGREKEGLLKKRIGAPRACMDDGRQSSALGGLKTVWTCTKGIDTREGAGKGVSVEESRVGEESIR